MPPTINTEECVGCGVCVNNCPGNVLEIIDSYAAVVRPEDCIDCYECENMCPMHAIAM